MAKVKNELKGKQKVLTHIVDSGAVIELSADEMKSDKIKHALSIGVLSEVKEQPKRQPKAKPEAKE